MGRNSVVFPVSLLFIFFLVLPSLPAQDSSGQSPERHEGTAPRTSAAKYRAHAEKDGIPVAGYLYFPIPKPRKDAKYQLVYSGRSEPNTLLLGGDHPFWVLP